MTIWDSRFEEPLDPRLFSFSRSLQFDARLAPHDIQGSLAHVQAMLRAELVTPEQARALSAGLEALRSQLRETGTLAWAADDEDVHGAIERLLGPVGRYLHAGRSRNDQVAVDLHLYVRHEARRTQDAVRPLQRALLAQARANQDVVVPGYTHLQWAQPVLLGHHLLAYFWKLERDCRRLQAVAAAARRSPLGAGALAGAGLPLDPEQTARDLGLDEVYPNSMDAVSDRDFALELGNACAIAQVHLSRLAEEIVLWSSREFGWVELPDAFSTGSSMMPQKKNPDAAELLRGKTGRVLGRLFGLYATLKGLPLTYMRDLQEDKEALFDIVDQVQGGLSVTAPLVAALRFHPPAIPFGDFIVATDVADHLVLQGVPFREAHRIVGRAVRLAMERGGNFAVLRPEDWTQLSPQFGDVQPLLDPARAVHRRDVAGGTAPRRLARQIALAEDLLSAAE